MFTSQQQLKAYPAGSTGSDPEHRAGDDVQRVLRLDEGYISDPGMGILDVDHAPSKGPLDDPIESDAEAQRWPDPGVFHRIVTAFRVMRKGAAAVVPFVEELLFQLSVENFVGDAPAAEYHLQVGRDVVVCERGPAHASVPEEHVTALVRSGHAHDQAIR